MPFYTFTRARTHTHPSWDVGVLSPADFPSITFPCVLPCHSRLHHHASLPVVFFCLKCHWHPNTHHLFASSLSFPPLPRTKEEALLCGIMAFRLDFWLQLFFVACRFVSSMDCEGFQGRTLCHTYIEPPHIQWNAHHSCSKWLVQRKDIHGYNCLLNICYVFRLDIDNSSCIDPDNKFLISWLVSWPQK